MKRKMVHVDDVLKMDAEELRKVGGAMSIDWSGRSWLDGHGDPDLRQHVARTLPEVRRLIDSLLKEYADGREAPDPAHERELDEMCPQGVIAAWGTFGEGDDERPRDLKRIERRLVWSHPMFVKHVLRAANAPDLLLERQGPLGLGPWHARVRAVTPGGGPAPSPGATPRPSCPA